MRDHAVYLCLPRTHHPRTRRDRPSFCAEVQCIDRRFQHGLQHHIGGGEAQRGMFVLANFQTA